MAQNITIQGASYTDVPAVTLPKTGGGTARFTDTSVTTAVAGDVASGKKIILADGSEATGTATMADASVSGTTLTLTDGFPIGVGFMGQNMELVQQVYDLDTKLSSTTYPSWTPSTTATTIIASTTISPAIAVNMANYDYYVKWVFDADIKYASGTTMKYTPTRAIYVMAQGFLARPSAITDYDNDLFAYNTNINNAMAYSGALFYNNSSGTATCTYAQYGPCYMSAQTAGTFSSTSSTTPNLTIKTPTIGARCSTSYFTTARAADVDTANTIIRMKGYLYRVAKQTSPMAGMWNELLDLYHHPLTGEER